MKLSNNNALMKEWDYEKNGDTNPEFLMYSSNRKVWWICQKGHSWKAMIQKRSIRNQGCPYCNNRKVMIGFNDLASRCPRLTNEWNYDRNLDITPETILYGSGKIVWWKCEKDHEWQTRVATRVHRKTNCPYCAGQRVVLGKNDLFAISPRFLSEWNYMRNNPLKPTDVMLNSHKKVWWICSKGHEWQSTVYNRTSGNNCRVCSGENHTSFPEQIIQYYLNKITKATSRTKHSGHEVDVYLEEYKIAIEYDGKYYHSGSNSENREEYKNKKLLDAGIIVIRIKESNREYVDLETKTIYTVYKRNYQYMLRVFKSLKQILYDITKNRAFLSIDVNIDRDMNVIFSQYIFSEKNRSFGETFPQLVKFWHPTKNLSLSPNQVPYSSAKKIWWICAKGHEWQSQPFQISRGFMCPFCANQKVLVGYNDLATTNPSLAMQWHSALNDHLTAKEVTAGSRKLVWWLCEKGHEWKAEIKSRSNGASCPYCMGKKAIPGVSDLVTTCPQLAQQWNYERNGDFKPTMFMRNSGRKIWWKCPNGHEWEASPNTRYSNYARSGKLDCKQCTRKQKQVE